LCTAGTNKLPRNHRMIKFIDNIPMVRRPIINSTSVFSSRPLLVRLLDWKLPLPKLHRWKIGDPVAIKMPLGDWIFWYGIALFMAALIPLFFLVVQPSLLGKNGLRIGADSAVYLWYSGLDSDSALLKTAYHVEQPYPDEVVLVAFGGNILGPVVIATTLKSNFLIMLFNYALFFVSLRYLFKLPGVRIKMLLTLLLINPITAVSIMTLNKEIIVLLAAALFAHYLESSRSKFMLLIVLAVSLVARWEQTACVVVFIVLTSRVNPWRKRRAFTTFLVIAGITVIYPQVAPFLNPVFLAGNDVGGGLLTALGWLQGHYFFYVALIPKMLMNCFGTFINMFYTYRTWNWNDLQNSFIGPLSGIILVIVMVCTIWSKRLNLNKDLIYYSVIFMVILSASPILQPRYMYPIYVFLCAELSRKTVISNVT
jgi:hypothetical protein